MFLTTTETADRLHFDTPTIRYWCQKYEGKFAVHIGSKWRIHKEAVQRVANGEPFDTLPDIRITI
jgi:excisionase family DNA binding protein